MPQKWTDEPWAYAPEVLIAKLETVYRFFITVKRVETPALLARHKIMQIREWCPAVPQDQLLKAIEDLEVFYIPVAVNPGPAILFPIRDVTGDIHRVHIRMNDPKTYGLRYISAVNKDRFLGPSWAGMDDDTMKAIIQTQKVIVMEGPFDLLAIRTMAPSFPSVCSLTKKLGEQHWDYLKILGVNHVYVMYDNEKRGQEATEAMMKYHKDVEITPVICPAHDPSDALKTVSKMQALRRNLDAALVSEAHTFVLEED